MNHRNLQRNEVLREKLAAEYVLGTLRHGARRRFEQWLAIDATLAQVVTRWQGRLHPMAELSPAVQPPASVWTGIERRLDFAGRRAVAPASLFSRLRDSLNFWRGVGVGASALAMLLVAVLATRAPLVEAPAVSYVAALSGENAQPAIVVTGDAVRRTLLVKVVGDAAVSADKVLQLWALPKQGAPRSLGLLAANGAVTLALPADVTPGSTPLLAVSLEPRGGSPNPLGPTGPILYKGALVQI
ncbi:MAG: anti-sigma factor [Pseudomonadota bacterium]